MPRSMCSREPFEGRVRDNLRKWGCGGCQRADRPRAGTACYDAPPNAAFAPPRRPTAKRQTMPDAVLEDPAPGARQRDRR